MKILFLDQFSEMGGAQRGLLDTLEAVDQRGWQAHVALPPGGPLIDMLRSRRVPITEIPCGPYHSLKKNAADVFRFPFDLRAQVRALDELRSREGFDLVYVNGPRLLPAAALSGPKLTPVLFHAHSHIEQRSAALVAQWSVRRADAFVVGCSRSVLESLRSSVAAAKLEVVPNGTREIEFRAGSWPRGGNWTIGMIGRISPEKGQAEFLHAALILAQHVPGARFVICGASLFADPKYFEAVQSLARGLPVDFLGWQEDVAPVFAQLDLLVVPSKQEGMGRVVVEAFSAGVPVVAFRAGGIPEVIVDDENGFLVAEATPEALAARIHEVLAAGSEFLGKITANARRAWERSYCIGVYQSRITELLERLASNAPAERETEALPRRK